MGGRRALWNCWQHAAPLVVLVHCTQNSLESRTAGLCGLSSSHGPAGLRVLHATRGSAVAVVCRRGDAAWGCHGVTIPWQLCTGVFPRGVVQRRLQAKSAFWGAAERKCWGEDG